MTTSSEALPARAWWAGTVLVMAFWIAVSGGAGGAVAATCGGIGIALGITHGSVMPRRSDRSGGVS